jgi:hypothetical protein
MNPFTVHPGRHRMKPSAPNMQDASQPVSPKARLFRGILPAAVLLVLIAGVYGSTLFTLYPDLPIIESMPVDIPGFENNYPPFRVDENVYYTISRHVLSGTLYQAKDASEWSFTLGFPLLAAPFVAMFGKMGGYIANLLIILASLGIFMLILFRYGFRKRALVLTLIMAFSSLDWFYAVSNYSEPLAQLFVLLAFALLVRSPHARWSNAAIVLSGVCTALNLFVRPFYLLLAVPFFLGLLFPKSIRPRFDRRAFLYCAGVTVTVLLWMVRNQLVFGSWSAFEYSRLVGSFTPGMASAYMKGNIFLGIHRLLFDQYHGLFTITPIFLLFPVGLRAMWLKGFRTESLVLLASGVLMGLFVASGPYPFTEFGLGSRHLVPLTPLLLLPAAFFLDGTFFSAALVTVVAVYSFYQAGIGWFTGKEPGKGFFIGILNDYQSRAIILSHKGLLPIKNFRSQEELVDFYVRSLRKIDLLGLLQSMDPAVRELIKGHEREFMLFLWKLPDPKVAILVANPNRGIIVRNFSELNGFENAASPDSIRAP